MKKNIKIQVFDKSIVISPTKRYKQDFSPLCFILNSTGGDDFLDYLEHGNINGNQDIWSGDFVQATVKGNTLEVSWLDESFGSNADDSGVASSIALEVAKKIALFFLEEKYRFNIYPDLYKVQLLKAGAQLIDPAKYKNDHELYKKMLDESDHGNVILQSKEDQSYLEKLIEKYEQFEKPKYRGWHYNEVAREFENFTFEIIWLDFKTEVYSGLFRDGQQKAFRTFFPDSWSEQKVLESVESGKKTKMLNHLGQWLARVDDVHIKYVQSIDSRIISAYPVQIF